MKYQLVIFDSDGTLADTLPWMRKSFNMLAEKHGFRKVAEDEHERFRDLQGKALLNELGLPLWKLPRVIADMRKTMTAHIDEFSLFPGIANVLRRISARGMVMAIVSSNSETNVRHILGSEIAALFAHFGCGVSMFGKAARLRAVVRTAHALPARTLYIGDEVRDAHAARAAKIAFGAVAWGQHRPETLRAQQPAEFFTSVEAIAEKLC